MAMLVQLICVKWRKRQFRRRSRSSRDRDSLSSSTASTTSTYFYPPSKELLYFFCWNNQSSPVEPPALRAPDAPIGLPELENISDILKWPGAFYVPRKFLFTISEDSQEKEATALEQNDSSKDINGGNVAASAPPEEVVMKGRESLRECLEAPQSIPAVEAGIEEESEVTAAAEVEEEEEEASQDDVAVATPFSTPCASPSYFTPWLSPVGDHHITIETDDDTSEFSYGSDSEAPQFVSVEIHGEGVGPDSGR
ncbi:hypothetical protein SAY87_026713 [Trapa incisa]|uniref:Uncharacterized protein n=1 Tax=Trapa incisa TaxID=236973 RepID=A0AAN7H1M5_9MYRT|nr:hypothetical protein SAY87_026713 [Trapa incisa]